MLKEHARARRAHYAATEAAEDDPIYAPDAIEHYVATVVALAESQWQGGGHGALEGAPDADLIRRWARWLELRFGRGLEVSGKPSIDLIGVVNRHDEQEDRVVVRIRLHLHCPHPKVGLIATRSMHVDERWTLGHRNGRWGLISMGDDPFVGPELTAPLIPTPSFDTERLREESLAELAGRAEGQRQRRAA